MMLDYTISCITHAELSGDYIYLGTNAAGYDYWKHETTDFWILEPNSGLNWVMTNDAAGFSLWLSNDAGFIDYMQLESTCYIYNDDPLMSPSIAPPTGRWTGHVNYELAILTVYPINLLPDIYTTADLDVLFMLEVFDDVYELMADIDYIGTDSGIGEAASAPFNGVLNGNGFTLSSLANHTSIYDYKGGLINFSYGCSVFNLNVETYVSGDDYIGGLIGILDSRSDSYIDYVSVVAAGFGGLSVAAGNSYVGGLIGYAITATGGTININECSVSGNIVRSGSGSFNYTGLLIGLVRTMDTIADQVVIKNSHTSGVVQGTCCVGGFIGMAYSSDATAGEIEIRIDKCSATGIEIQGYGVSAGNSYYRHHGGFIGRTASVVNSGYPESRVKITRSYCEVDMDYSFGQLTASNQTPYYMGGFVGEASDLTEFEDCVSTADIVVSDMTMYSGTFQYKVTIVGGFVGCCFKRTSFKNCFANGSLVMPAPNIYNTHLFFSATGGDPDYNDDYNILGMAGSSYFLTNAQHDRFLVYDSVVSSKYYIVDSVGFANYLAGDIDWTDDYYVSVGTGASGLPISQGIGDAPVQYIGVGLYEGSTITLSAIVNTDTTNLFSGGFCGMTFGVDEGSGFIYSTIENCVVSLETDYVSGGHVFGLYTTDGKFGFTGDGNYYDSTKSPESEIHPDFASQIEAKTSTEFSNKSGLPKLDFVESLSDETGWYMGHDGHPELMAFRPEIVNFNKLQNEIGALA